MDNRTLEQFISQLQVHESEDQLIIGLDFGTTFSGCAYAFAKGDEKPELVSILDWPGAEAYKQPKVPTVISYDPMDPEQYTWGAQEHHHSRIEGIKLLLDPEQPKPLYVPPTDTKAELKKVGKPPIEVATDFMEAIYKHTMSRIEAKIPLAYLQLCQKKFVLSVPAVWSDKAKEVTLRAARQANMYPVTLIKEPEAAALYTLYQMQDRAIEIGDALVICDAGGGTVDLTSYGITALKPRLELEQLVPSKGGMAGSLQLNKIFEGEVRNLVGEEQYYTLRKSESYKQAVEYFDKTVKVSFRGTLTEKWYVTFPGANLDDDKECGLSRDSWLLTGEKVKNLFEPLILDILRLVESQVQAVQNKRLSDHHPQGKKIKGIFLVGGFGNSEYLKQRIQAENPDIQVIQPHDAWAAIVKGAVLFSLPNQAIVTKDVAEVHYGVSAMELYNEEKDKDQEKVKDETLGKYRVEKMTWYIYKHDDLKRNLQKRFPFYRTLPKDFHDDRLIFKDELITDANNRPAEYPKAGITKVNCKLTADLRGVDRSTFKSRSGADGKSYVDVHYDLVVTSTGAQLKFSLEINGQEMGSVDANYE